MNRVAAILWVALAGCSGVAKFGQAVEQSDGGVLSVSLRTAPVTDQPSAAVGDASLYGRGDSGTTRVTRNRPLDASLFCVPCNATDERSGDWCRRQRCGLDCEPQWQWYGNANLECSGPGSLCLAPICD